MLHFLYISIQEGRFQDARRLLRYLKWFARATSVRGFLGLLLALCCSLTLCLTVSDWQDDGLLESLEAAKHHWRNVVFVQLAVQAGVVPDASDDAVDERLDPFYRQRLLKM